MTDFVKLLTSSTPGRAAAVSISERVVTGPTFLSIVVSEVEGECTAISKGSVYKMELEVRT